MSALPILESARVRLRAIEPDDAEALHPAYADPVTMKWWSSPPHTSLEQTRAYLTIRQNAADLRSWAIVLRDGNQVIGTVTAIHKRAGVSEIGYLLDRRHGRQGLASEAVRLLLDQLFDAEAHRRVFADVDPDNAASRRLLERLGFVAEGVLRAEWETHIGIRDTVLYGLLKEERTWPRPT
jgi:[ribosomal protein S5]-alanine N-acetyltransferase